ncbi:MAG: Holliday junction branch migration protein RuvA [Parcubacteria group bacterium]|nr:Holliday junction branch migration protein RuvA [Parcubacteria group bacterium]
MIIRLAGMIYAKGHNYAVIEANDIGYKVHVTPEMLSRMAERERATLWTHQVVREDSTELFGFETRPELEFFEMLIGISGIGPRSAIAILSLAPVTTLKRAIAGEDTTYLTKVSGIGKKTAAKIVLELKEKIVLEDGEEVGNTRSEEGEVLEALVSLGYQLRDAREALKKVGSETLGTNEKIKEALKVLTH